MHHKYTNFLNFYMKLKLSSHFDTYYILPGLRIYYDTFYEGGLSRFSLEVFWLKWSIDLVFIDR
jgi:hypothetical protein